MTASTSRRHAEPRTREPRYTTMRDSTQWFANRPIVRHEWLHRRRVYADCYLFEDSGERLAQTYRSDWAPQGQEQRLIAEGFVHGKGWIQTLGLGEPDRVVHVRGRR